MQLVRYTWADEVALMERELARARALLALEEQKNAKLPDQVPLASAEEHDRRFAAAVTEYMAFLAHHDILTIATTWTRRCARRSAGTARRPLRILHRGRLPRPGGDADPRLSLVRHGPDGRTTRTPIPIRRGALLYNIFNTRTEGLATGWKS